MDAHLTQMISRAPPSVQGLRGGALHLFPIIAPDRTLTNNAVGPCQRCGQMAELGACPRCHRDLCVDCYDQDQEFNNPCVNLSRPDPRLWAREAQRMAAEGLPVRQIAQQVRKSRRAVYRVTQGERA